MRIGKKGLNPTIPLCLYCGEAKNEIVLTGLEGERWAEKNGLPGGEMPMHIHIAGDVEPCNKCKEKGIALVEVVSDNNKSMTGNRWLVKDDFIKRLVNDKNLLESILKKRILMIPSEISKMIGLNV